MSRILCLIFCILCMDLAMQIDGFRFIRSSMGGGVGASASSSSSSSSSGGTFAGSGFPAQGGYGGYNPGNFMFPSSNYPFFQFPGAGGAPFQDFNALYQQFLASLYSAQAHAAQNPAYAPIFQQQLTSLIAQQQAAMAQFPFAFPNYDSNTIAHGSTGSAGYQGAGQPVVGSATYPGSTYGSGSSYSGSTAGSGASSYPGSTLGSGASYPGGAGGGASYSGHPASGGSTYSGSAQPAGGNTAFTSASVNYGPQGGYGQASAFPGGPDGLGVRIAEELPGPSNPKGGAFGVFTSSSSGTSTVNGKTTSYKTSTFGTNDNGKITFKTVNE